MVIPRSEWQKLVRLKHRRFRRFRLREFPVPVLAIVAVLVLTAMVVAPTEAGVSTTGSSIVLTFDDGPDPVNTPKLLNTLKLKRVRAIFCVTGEHARWYPKLIQRIHNEGHLLCVHSYNHVRMDQRPFSSAKWQIETTIYFIRRAVPNVPIPYFRAPYGQSRADIDYYARTKCHFTLLGWNVFSRDWGNPGVNYIVSTTEYMIDTPAYDSSGTTQLPLPGPGAWVLLHDANGTNHVYGSTVYRQAVYATPRLIDHYGASRFKP